MTDAVLRKSIAAFFAAGGTTEELARVGRVREATVRRWRDEGALPKNELVRATIERWLERRAALPADRTRR